MPFLRCASRMSAIEVVVRPRPETPPSSALRPLEGLIDVIVDGINITARLGDSQALIVLAGLAHATSVLSRGTRERTALPLHTEDEAWEIGLLADGSDVLISIYRTGPVPSVAVHDRRVDLSTLRQAIVRAIDESHSMKLPVGAASALLQARRTLDLPWPSALSRPLERRLLSLGSDEGAGLSFSAQAEFPQARRTTQVRPTPSVERADLHSLLVRGTVAAIARGRSVRLPSVFLFFFAERLVSLAEEALGAWRDGRPLLRRVSLDGAQIRLSGGADEGGFSLTLCGRDACRDQEGVTLVRLDPPGFFRAVTQFASALGQRFVQSDPSQCKNLRLSSMLRAAGDLEASLEEATLDDSLTNPEPESYRGFGLPRMRTEPGIWEHGGKMRFLPRWVATVPGIDLRATFHCGQKIVVGSERETVCLDRATGDVLWRKSSARCASVATPLGIARLYADGLIELLDLEVGEARFSTRLRPRRGSGATGALVNTPGLPRLLIVAEGDSSITAIDLVSGDIRWRFTTQRSGTPRLRRAGRLLLLAGGGSPLVAIDVLTGEVVWRVRDRLAFNGDLCVDKDSAFALAGGPIGPVKLFHVDLWTGAQRWSRELEQRPILGQAPLVVKNRVIVPIRDRRGPGAIAFEPVTGNVAWTHEPGLAAPTTAWLAVDDALVANCASGVLFCIDGESGRLRYNHVFSRHVEADQPRRLEPVLRNGALFVPQHRVHVVRPGDGEIIGTLPSELIPDLIRVDERCSVYIGEESGHLAAFSAAPRLALVR